MNSAVTVSIIRHAKSGWDDPGLRDYDRPLTVGGQADAQRIGEWFAAQQIAGLPERWLVSSAQRTQATAGLLLQAMQAAQPGYTGQIETQDALYLAPPSVWLDAMTICTKSHALQHLALVGHNPGLSLLSGQLIGRSMDLSTSQIVMLQYSSWADMLAGEMPRDWSTQTAKALR